MKFAAEIKLKEENDPTMWERFVHWLNGADGSGTRPVLQVPKTGTNTEILLSQTQKIILSEAVESPGGLASDTSFRRKSDQGQDGAQLII